MQSEWSLRPATREDVNIAREKLWFTGRMQSVRSGPSCRACRYLESGVSDDPKKNHIPYVQVICSFNWKIIFSAEKLIARHEIYLSLGSGS